MDKNTRKNIDAPLTVTALLNKATTEFCLNFCKYAEECAEAIQNNEELRSCPLDIIGG